MGAARTAVGSDSCVGQHGDRGGWRAEETRVEATACRRSDPPPTGVGSRSLGVTELPDGAVLLLVEDLPDVGDGTDNRESVGDHLGVDGDSYRPA